MPPMKLHLGLDARKLTDFGIGTYVGELLRGLEGSDECRLTVLARDGHEDRVKSLAPSARVLAVSAGEYSLAEHVKVPMALWREPVDVLHVPHYVVPMWTRRLTVVTIHDVIQLFYPPEQRTQLALLYLRAMMRSTLRRATRVITVSRTSRKDLINIFGAEPDKVRVVPNGVEPETANRPDAEVLDELRERLGLKSPLLLVVANDKTHKNLDMVLRSFHLACVEHGLPGQLVFVGGVRPDGRLARRAEALGLADRVRFVGRVSRRDLRSLYHAAAVLLHVALYEGFGLPVLEAMAAGLPVITSNVGAMQELGEGAARLVNPLDVREISNGMAVVLVDDPLRRRMIEAGRRKAQKLSWERTVERTLEVYREALESGAGRGTFGRFRREAR